MKKIIILTVLLGVISLFSACNKQEENVKADEIDLGAQPVHQSVEAYGLIKATKIKDITIDFPGFVEEINVKNGQQVQQGDVLMELSTEDFSAQIKELECDLNAMKAQKELTKEQKDKITVLEENLELMKGKLTKDYLTDNKVRSDVPNGLVYNIENVKGDMVYSGSRLVSIADLDSLIVSANIDEQFIAFVAEGAKVEIIPEYDKSLVMNGTVSFISSKAFQNNGETTVPVEITLSEDIEELILDADVQVKIYPVEQ